MQMNVDESEEEEQESDFEIDDVDEAEEEDQESDFVFSNKHCMYYYIYIIKYNIKPNNDNNNKSTINVYQCI